MTTITNTITITIAIAIAIAIPIAINSYSPRRIRHPCTHNRWEAGRSLCWKISVGNLLSPDSNCLPFLPNLTLQLSTPLPCSIMRFRLAGRTQDKFQTIILTNVMISATIRLHPLTTHHPPLASCLLVPSDCNTASSWTEHTGAFIGAYCQVRLGVSCLWRV